MFPKTQHGKILEISTISQVHPNEPQIDRQTDREDDPINSDFEIDKNFPRKQSYNLYLCREIAWENNSSKLEHKSQVRYRTIRQDSHEIQEWYMLKKPSMMRIMSKTRTVQPHDFSESCETRGSKIDGLIPFLNDYDSSNQYRLSLNEEVDIFLDLNI